MQFPAQFFVVFGSHCGTLVVEPHPEQVEAIVKLSAPIDIHILRLFLGYCNYYERFIPRYAHISTPLTDLLRTGAE